MTGGAPAVRVAFQGEPGAYSADAAESFFSGRGVEAVPHQTFAEALQSAESGRADCAMLPVENSIEGSVGEASDLLYGTPLRALGESYHRIEHCLIGHGRIGDVRTVYSHPQALGQCRRFIRENGWRAVPAYDTAGSAMMVAAMGASRVDAACIASRHAAGVHGVPVIRDGIMDRPDNYTRFLVMGTAGPGGRAGGAALAEALAAAGRGRPLKTSVIFSARHEPGALAGIIGAFGRRGISMTRIESRPTRSAAWEYNFYVDFEGGGAGGVIDEIRGAALSVKVVGTYPAADAGGDGGGGGGGAQRPLTRRAGGDTTLPTRRAAGSRQSRRATS